MRVLMVCFEFPPAVGPSVQRIRSVYEGFLGKGYDVDIITVSESCHRNLDPFSLFWVSDKSLVIRCYAFDAVDKLSVYGKHFSFTSTPDRFAISWGVTFKRRLKSYFNTFSPDIVWSSSPIPTCHKIADYVKTVKGSFWIADYRDPFPHKISGVSFFERFSLEAIDRKVSERADVITFATEKIQDIYRNNYSIDHKSFVMKNGFNESQFDAIKGETGNLPWKGEVPVLYYAGVLYPDGRDPRNLFSAMKSNQGFNLVFQGSGDGEEFFSSLSGVRDRVRFLPSVSSRYALINMLSADALLIIQGSIFSSQIPSKLYEMLKTGKPILLLAPPDSETAKEAMRFNGVFVAESVEGISAALKSVFKSGEVQRCNIQELERGIQFESMFEYVNSEMRKKGLL